MFLAFMIYGGVEMQIFGDGAYKTPAFLDYEQNMMFFTLGLVFLKLLHAFLLSYLHELVPRCGSSWWSKVWRFSLLSFFLVHAVGLGMTYLTMNVDPYLVLSWALGGLFQTFVCCGVIIPILYSFPPKDSSCRISSK